MRQRTTQVRRILWRYTKRGRCRHALVNGRYIAICGHRVEDVRDWLGSEGPNQRRVLISLPPCQKCQHFIDTSPETIVDQA